MHPQPPNREQGGPRVDPSQFSSDALIGSLDSDQNSGHPEAGFRGWLYRASNGRINLGRSKDETLEDRLNEAIRAILGGDVWHVAVWSQKGGVGKSTTAVATGVALASQRTDKIVGMDVNPDGGSMAVRVPRTTDKTILDLRDSLRRGPVSPVEFSRFVNTAQHRFDTIVMPPGKKPDSPLSADDHQMIVRGLSERYPYKLVLTDCGTNLTDDVMSSVLATAHQLIVPTTNATDEAAVTAGGLEALMRGGHEHLVRNAITVLVEKVPPDSNVEVQREIDRDTTKIENHFKALTSQVIRVPYDPRIRIGKIFDMKTIDPETRIAYLRVAAAVVGNLAQKS